MKANELRIGNQIYVNSVLHQVTAVDILTIAQNELFGIEMPYCNPVKLTEELLLKSGFRFMYEKVSDRVYSNEDFMLYWNRQSGYHLFYHDKLLSRGIAYWHQLQNLYQEVTGQLLSLL